MEDFPWPESGDELFRERDRIEDAWIHPSTVNFVVYADSYKQEADELVKSAVGKKTKSDKFIFPILYLYRHHIELQMKFIIRTARRLPGEDDPDYKHHRLKKLWRECRSIIEEAFPHGENDDIEVVENVVIEFAQADPGSYTFRYPEDKKEEPTIEGEEFIDLFNLYEVMQKTSNFFDGSGDGIYDMADSIPRR